LKTHFDHECISTNPNPFFKKVYKHRSEGVT